MHLDVLNGRYNPEGRIAAHEVTLPGPAWSPQLMLLFSVFTHMYPDDIGHYVEQLARLMPRGASACVTFFLLNSESQRMVTSEKAAFTFPYRYSETCFYYNEQDPLYAIAFDEGWVYEMLRANGLGVDHIIYGTWCGRVGTRVFQDTLIIRRF